MIKADPKDLIVRRQVRRIELGLYSDDDVRERSVVEITSPQSFLNEKTPLPGGLYDPKLGPVGAHESLPCPTCGCRFLTCPGHFGHIECCVPLYQPLLWSELLQVLRCKCFACHRLKPPKRSLLVAHAKLLLLKHHRLDDYHDLDAKLAILIHTATEQGDLPTQAQRTRQAGAAMESELLRIIHELEGKKHEGRVSTYQTTLLRKYRAEVLRTWKATPKCRHCGAFSPRLKSDQSNKVFLTQLSQTQARLNEADNIEISSAIEALAARSSGKPKKEDDDGYDSEDTDVRPGGKKNSFVDDEAMEVTEEDAEKEDMEVDAEEDPDKDKKKDASAAQKYMHSKEVQAQCHLTWQFHGALLTHALLAGTCFGDDPKLSYRALFVQAIAVPPSRFRPPMVMGGMTVEHAQNHYLSKLLTENAQVRQELLVNKNERLAHTFWIQLQTTLNCFVDSSKDPSAYTANTPIGIRQLLEKKEGIFRKHMMGKRVDSACRSVISPDPYIGTNEIGIPMAFARVLTYPTPVTEWNMTELRRLVERGPHQYPGAKWVEIYKDGKAVRVDLTKMTQQKRQSVGAMLLQSGKNGGRPAVVGRQLRHGDTMLVNRQPTLHKPGIMAHQVRILHDPNQKTIRMHYANCNTYNADYDGDEMNCHFPQSDVARAEAVHIASTDLQYIVPTDGSPLRGLIQDHVCGGVKLTMRDTFLKRWEYQQLLFATLASLPKLEVLESYQDIQMVPPAILKPEPLWTGKQVITTLLLHLCNSPRGQNHSSKRENASNNMLNQGGLSLERKSKTPATAFGAVHEEHLVLIRDGELLRGILDKGAFGATDFSLVHGVYEAYGPTKAGLLLNSLGRLFTAYIQSFSGHSCRVEDLVLTPESNKIRRDLVERAYNVGSRACKAWADSEGGKVPIEPVSEKEGANKPLKPVEVATASAKIGRLLGGAQGAENFAALDGYMMSQLNPLASDIVKKTLPKGLAVPFPANTFGLMTTTGAKGSIVNQSQVTCALGQQALEGRRVPRLNSGRTLPSFAPYDLNPRADGFVMDRFLTGVRPQEYYFHCMAGREGLVDTAVKTSRSGYLQRCLIKHLEELTVCYDYTVRNGEGGVVQFLYGEDALDPTKASYLDCTEKSFEFMTRNHGALTLQNTPLPGSSIDIAAADHVRSNAVACSNEDASNLMKKGSRVLARRLRDGTEWTRGALLRGWHEAVVKKAHKGEETFDLEYIKDKHRVSRVPISVNLGRCGGANERAASSECLLLKPAVPEPIVSAAAGSRLKTRTKGVTHSLGSTGACVSERLASAAAKALQTKGLETAMKSCKLSADDVGNLVAAKFGSALCAPGEAVGSIAAQSVGEPSTQMTLNTFHLAGAGANVTLGIPRLREIIMTASKTLKTPTMSIPLRESVTEAAATRLTNSFTRLDLMELIASERGVTVRETLMKGDDGGWERAYFVVLKLHPVERISAAFGLSLKQIATCVGDQMVTQLATLMKMELKRSATEGDISVAKVVGSSGTKTVKESGDGDDMDTGNDDGNRNDNNKAANDLTDEEDNGSGDEGGEEDGVAASKYNRSEDKEASYGVGDDGEESDSGSGGQRDQTMQTNDTPQSDIRDAMSLAPSAGEVKIDKKTNSIILAPLRVDPAARPLLMVGLVERAAMKTLIRSKKKIDQAFVNKEEGRGRCLQTAGVNFDEFWRLPSSVVDHDGLMSNDTWAIRGVYGVEAARSNIVEQIRSVFGAYGIEVDPRHLSLIADYMTFEGGYKAMNRIGMEEMSSTLLQMSFETTAHFLTQAALSKTKDELQSPSANIVLGRPIRQGTGAFDVLAKTVVA